MKVAEILSDLTSLRVCDHEAAMALVSCRPGGEEQAKSEKSENEGAGKSATPSRNLSGLEGHGDPDLQRALDLVDLHYGVKEKYSQGTDMSLEAARSGVNKVLQDLQQRDENSE
ncbi:hypothetical protein MMC10_003364 [Thelotrema lepadinum]|nr:hypothetical protein [Thelotrema lepadinum]